jgi:hypothetical protein
VAALEHAAAKSSNAVITLHVNGCGGHA